MDEIDAELTELRQAELAFEAEKRAKEADWPRNQNRLELAQSKVELEEFRLDQLNAQLAGLIVEEEQLDTQISSQQTQLEQMEVYETHLNDFAHKMGYSHPLDVIKLFSYYKSASSDAQRHFAANQAKLQQLTSALINHTDDDQVNETIKQIELMTTELLEKKSKRKQLELEAEKLYTTKPL